MPYSKFLLYKYSRSGFIDQRLSYDSSKLLQGILIRESYLTK